MERMLETIKLPFKTSYPTPFFIFDRKKIEKQAILYQETTKKAEAELLYSTKTNSYFDILKWLSKYVDGFSVSSLFELQVVKSFDKPAIARFISPGIRPCEWESLSKLANSITFNSLKQFLYFEPKMEHSVNIGIRLNPELSFVKDDRYNPCRKDSRLGESLEDFLTALENSSFLSSKLKGIHFHTNHGSHNLSQLKKTFLKIKTCLGDRLKQFEWINLGGGYYLDKMESQTEFLSLAKEIKESGLETFIIEPGTSIIKNSVYLVSSVIDLFTRKGKTFAILDTSVNHLPEVFEYQYQPSVFGDNGQYPYVLTGSSCLAGDIFGNYFLDRKLKIGSQVIFSKVGSYSLVKANWFNGIKLPDIYSYEGEQNLRKLKTYSFSDYSLHFGGR